MFVDFVHTLVASEAQEMPLVLHLFGGPFVTCERRRLEVPEGSKRLLVFVALHRGRIERRYAAGALWPTGDDMRAAGNLRSALWRLNGAGINVLSADKHGLAMRDDALVNVHIVSSWAARLIKGSATRDDLGITPRALMPSICCPGGTTIGPWSSVSASASDCCMPWRPRAVSLCNCGGALRRWRPR